MSSSLVDIWDNKQMRKLAKALCAGPESEECQDSGQNETTTEKFPLKDKQKRGAGKDATVRVECSTEEMARRLENFIGEG